MKQEHEMTPGVLVSDDHKPSDPVAALEALVTACWDFSSESVECKYDGFYSEVVASREWDKFRAAVEAADGVLAAAPAPVERCDTCHGHGEVPTGETQRFGDLHPPEPIMMACPECSGHATAERVEQEEVSPTHRFCFGSPQPVTEIVLPGNLVLFMDGRDGAVVLRIERENASADWAGLRGTTPQPAPTAAQDVAELVRTLELIARESQSMGAR